MYTIVPFNLLSANNGVNNWESSKVFLQVTEDKIKGIINTQIWLSHEAMKFYLKIIPLQGIQSTQSVLDLHTDYTVG